MVAPCSTWPQSLKCCADGTPAVIVPPSTLVCPAQPVPALSGVSFCLLILLVAIGAYPRRPAE
jgi:hypothetical protein